MTEPLRLQIRTEPAAEPVTLAELKTFMRIDGSEDDALIESLIVAARELCESYTGRALITQELYWR